MYLLSQSAVDLACAACSVGLVTHGRDEMIFFTLNSVWVPVYERDRVRGNSSTLCHWFTIKETFWILFMFRCVRFNSYIIHFQLHDYDIFAFCFGFDFFFSCADFSVYYRLPLIWTNTKEAHGMYTQTLYLVVVVFGWATATGQCKATRWNTTQRYVWWCGVVCRVYVHKNRINWTNNK